MLDLDGITPGSPQAHQLWHVHCIRQHLKGIEQHIWASRDVVPEPPAPEYLDQYAYQEESPQW